MAKNLRFGIIYTIYNQIDYLDRSLKPFLDDEDCIVAAACSPFKGFDIEEDDGTLAALRSLESDGRIKLFANPIPLPEYTVRDRALVKLVNDVDYIWLVDGDEFYIKEQIEFIKNFVTSCNGGKDFYFRIPLRNFFKDTKHYLEKPFEPPRIFPVVTLKGDRLNQFYWDNDVAYGAVNNARVFSYEELLYPYTFLTDQVWIDHYSWLDNERSRKKIEYQKRHFGHCSYKWGENGLEFDENYYNKTGETKPNVLTL